MIEDKLVALISNLFPNIPVGSVTQYSIESMVTNNTLVTKFERKK